MEARCLGGEPVKPKDTSWCSEDLRPVGEVVEDGESGLSQDARGEGQVWKGSRNPGCHSHELALNLKRSSDK